VNTLCQAQWAICIPMRPTILGSMHQEKKQNDQRPIRPINSLFALPYHYFFQSFGAQIIQ
jgi:hypothetical protein